MNRRDFLTSVTTCSALTLVGFGQLLASQPVLAAPVLDRAFAARGEAEALRVLFGFERSQPCERVVLGAPFVTAPGLGLRIKIRCDRPGAHAIAVTIREAEHPLATIVRLHGADCFFGTDLRMERSSTVTAHVLVDGGLFSASKAIKVTRGGYGMP